MSDIASKPKPQVVTGTVIQVFHANQIHEGGWRASAIIVWPDGSCDVGASNLDGKTKREAEDLAAQKALDRWERIEVSGTLNKSHAAPGSVLQFAKT